MHCCRRHEAATRRYQQAQTALRQLRAAQQVRQHQLDSAEAALAAAEASAAAAAAEQGDQDGAGGCGGNVSAAAGGGQAAGAGRSGDSGGESGPVRQRRKLLCSTPSSGSAPPMAAGSGIKAPITVSARKQRHIGADPSGEASEADAAANAGATGGTRPAAQASSSAGVSIRSRAAAHSAKGGGDSSEGSDSGVEDAASARRSRRTAMARRRGAGRPRGSSRGPEQQPAAGAVEAVSEGASCWSEGQVAEALEELEERGRLLQARSSVLATQCAGCRGRFRTPVDIPPFSASTCRRRCRRLLAALP